MASTLAQVLTFNCQHIAPVLYCYNCRIWHFGKLDFNHARDQHIASPQLLLSKRTEFSLSQHQIECKIVILLLQMQLLAKYLPIFIHNIFLACSANFQAAMLAFQWSYLIFLLPLLPFLFLHFVIFYSIFCDQNEFKQQQQCWSCW